MGVSGVGSMNCWQAVAPMPFRLCLESDSFGSVLRRLKTSETGGQSIPEW
jgi:hypothetical protein